MTTKFTTGPWRYEAVSDACRVVIGQGRQRIILARLAPKQLREAETTANAHLISAAPDLYEALNRMVEAAVLQPECAHSREPDLCDDCAFEREKSIGLAASAARAALAKAEGRS